MTNSDIIEINAVDAYKKLKNNDQSVLIDVRTQSEWDTVGFPNLSNFNKKVIKLSILHNDGAINQNFEIDFQNLNIDKNEEIFFICKSGKRSRYSGEIVRSLGFIKIYNISDGYINGWLKNNLPT